MICGCPWGLRTAEDKQQSERVKPVVWGKLGNKNFLVFLDTGAAVNLMSEQLYSEHFSAFQLQATEEVVCDIHTQKIDVVGKIALTLSVGGQEIRTSVLVARGVNLGKIILLGHSACAKNQVSLCPSQGGIYIGQGKQGIFVPYAKSLRELETGESGDNREVVMLKELVKDNYSVKGVLKDTVDLKPGVPLGVRLEVKGVKDGVNVIVTEGSDRVQQVSAVVALGVVTNQETWVELVSCGETDRRLRKGTYMLDMEVFTLPVMVNSGVDAEPVWLTEGVGVKLDGRREELLKKKLQGSDYQEFNSRLIDLLNRYPDVVACKGDKLGLTNVIEHKVILEKGTGPIYIPAYRIPVKVKGEVEKTVAEWESEGIIRKSSSPFNFPLLAVPKKDGSYRVCVDFRRLNEKTIPDRYPAACMQDLVSEIGGKKIYTSIDLLQGFLQVPLAESSREYTAFSTPTGHWEFARMPFGLKGSPTTFTRLVNTVFHGMLGKSIFVYMDDLLIGSDSIEQHLEILEEVLHRLRVAGLKLKLEKCDFLKREIVYLGHIVSEQGVRVNPGKIKAITCFPEPKSKKNIKQFLGLAGFFRKFVKGFSQKAAPLTEILKGEVPFKFGEKEREAFITLKEALMKPPVLRFPDFDLPFVIVTDASGLGMGGCLMQKHGRNLHPIAFFSRKWKTRSPDETKLSTIDKEAYAVVSSLLHFRYLILGFKVVVYTDHKPLVDLFNKPSLSPKRARWSVIINDFDPEIKYIEGKSNLVADALSRNLPNDSLEVCQVGEGRVDWNEQVLIKEQDSDVICSKAKSFLRGELQDRKYKLPTWGLELSGNLLVRRVTSRTRGSDEQDVLQVVVPEKLVPVALRVIHELMGGDHMGVDRTYNQAKSKYFWKGMYRDIENYVKNCRVCNQYKSSSLQTKIATYPLPSRPFERVHMDLITNFAVSDRGNKHLLVIVDELTRYVEMCPIKNKTAEEVGVAFFNKFVCRHGVPEVLISDNGREFNNRVFETLAELMKINKVNIQPYRPEANGVCERANKKILEALRTTVGGEDPNWDLHLDYIQFSVNSNMNDSIKMSAHKALYGVNVRNPFDFFTGDRIREDTVGSLVRSAQDRFVTLRSNLGQAAETMTKKVNDKQSKRIIQVGDKVFVKINVRNQLNYKLGPKFEGPFEVMESLIGNKFRVKNMENDADKVVHISQLKLVLEKKKKVRFLL